MTPIHPTQASVGEVRHTKGPWLIERRRGNNGNITAIGPCAADEYVGSAWLDVSEDDARLIAAAPDMLAALFDCRRALEVANFTQELAVVDAAIARATSLPNEANHD